MSRTKRKDKSITNCNVPRTGKTRRKLNKKKQSKQHSGKDCWFCW